MSGGSHLGDFFNNRKEPGCAGLPVMSVTMNDSLVLRDDLERRTESALRPDQHLLVRKGDIAYNMMRMWQGACGLATANCIVSPAYVVLAPKSGIDSRFAYHWFKSSRMIHLFWAYSHGLTEDRLRLYFDEFAEIPASPPPLEQQRRIVAVLDVWDQAIDEIERLIVANKKRQSSISELLFGTTNRAKRDEWESFAVEEVADCFAGGTPDRSRQDFYGGNVPWVKSGEVESSKIICTEEKLTQAGLASSSARWVPKGSTLVAMYGANAGQVGRLGIDATTNQAILALIPNTTLIDSEFLYYSVLNSIPSLMRKVQGSGQPNLSGTIVKEEKILVPEMSRQIAIARTASALETTLNSLTAQLRLIDKQRRVLLQKLINGEWRLDERFDARTFSPRTALVGGEAWPSS